NTKDQRETGHLPGVTVEEDRADHDRSPDDVDRRVDRIGIQQSVDDIGPTVGKPASDERPRPLANQKGSESDEVPTENPNNRSSFHVRPTDWGKEPPALSNAAARRVRRRMLRGRAQESRTRSRSPRPA